MAWSASGDRSGDMIFSIPVLIEYISGVMTLEPGDLILTGTPEGVGKLAPGDVGGSGNSRGRHPAQHGPRRTGHS